VQRVREKGEITERNSKMEFQFIHRAKKGLGAEKKKGDKQWTRGEGRDMGKLATKGNHQEKKRTATTQVGERCTIHGNGKEGLKDDGKGVTKMTMTEKGGAVKRGGKKGMTVVRRGQELLLTKVTASDYDKREGAGSPI